MYPLPSEPTLLPLMHQSLYCTQHRTKPTEVYGIYFSTWLLLEKMI